MIIAFCRPGLYCKFTAKSITYCELIDFVFRTLSAYFRAVVAIGLTPNDRLASFDRDRDENLFPRLLFSTII